MTAKVYHVNFGWNERQAEYSHNDYISKLSDLIETVSEIRATRRAMDPQDDLTTVDEYLASIIAARRAANDMARYMASGMVDDPMLDAQYDLIQKALALTLEQPFFEGAV